MRKPQPTTKPSSKNLSGNPGSRNNLASTTQISETKSVRFTDPPTSQPLNTSTPQPLNTSTPQLINPGSTISGDPLSLISEVEARVLGLEASAYRPFMGQLGPAGGKMIERGSEEIESLKKGLAEKDLILLEQRLLIGELLGQIEEDKQRLRVLRETGTKLTRLGGELKAKVVSREGGDGESSAQLTLAKEKCGRLEEQLKEFRNTLSGLQQAKSFLNCKRGNKEISNEVQSSRVFEGENLGGKWANSVDMRQNEKRNQRISNDFWNSDTFY